MKQGNSIGFELCIVANMLKRSVDAEIQANLPEDISVLQSHVIGFLSHRQKEDTFQRDIEASFSLRRSTVSEVLSLMEKKGLIRREAVEHDARLKKIIPTPHALRLHKTVIESIDSAERMALSGLTEEDIHSLHRVLETIKYNLHQTNNCIECSERKEGMTQ